ncbi:MAG: AbrB/MazE/SpoVT family DNA-binding domain-containing protein [Saprospiraceae bacterium]
MQIRIISVGNSKVIRLNKVLLQKYNIEDVVELVMEPDCIILRPVKKVREGWDDAFRVLHENSDDQLLMPDVFEEETFVATSLSENLLGHTFTKPSKV